MTEEMHDQEIKDLHDKIDKLSLDMQPIIDTFKTLRQLGKWAAIGVAFMGSITGVALAIKELFKKH